MKFHHATVVTNIQGALTAILDRHWLETVPLGGYLAAIALRAAGLQSPNGQCPIVMSCQYLSMPKPGGVSALIETVSSGLANCISVALWQDGHRLFQAQIWIAADEHEASRADDTRPEMFGQSAAFADHFQHLAAEWPELHSYFDLRVSLNPVSGRDRSDSQALRVLDLDCGQDRFLDAARLAMAIALSCRPGRPEGGAAPFGSPASNLDLTVWFLASAPDQDWLVVSALHDRIRQGLVHTQAEVRSQDGQLLAAGGAHVWTASAKLSACSQPTF